MVVGNNRRRQPVSQNDFQGVKSWKERQVKRNSRRGPWWLWPFSLICEAKEREREISRVNTSREGFHEKRGDCFATPRFSARRRLAVAGGGMLLQGWKQQIDIWLYETTLLNHQTTLTFASDKLVNNRRIYHSWNTEFSSIIIPLMFSCIL